MNLSRTSTRAFSGSWSRLASAALFTVSWLLTAPAHAAPDAFGLGDGSDGAFTAATGSSTINTYSTLSADASSGATTIMVSTPASFSNADLILIVQIKDGSYTSGDSSSVTLGPNSVGRYNLARISNITGSTLTFSPALSTSFAMNGAQVVRVHEYTTFGIAAGRTVTAPAWNGATGGIVAFLATGAITISGTLTVANEGFRGGAVSDNLCAFTCSATDPGDGRVDSPCSEGMGRRGEGIDSSATGFLTCGTGNKGNSGGGGGHINAGGAGGGNGGFGGAGGNSWGSNLPVGGKGGARLVGSLTDALTFGGGGGGGQQNNNVAAHGGAGGGILWFRGASLAATGVISANGETPPDGANDGGGGGGAAGSIVVATTGSAACSTLAAVGGNGTNIPSHGGGAGGGGGRVYVTSTAGTCTPATGNGIAGTGQPYPPYGGNGTPGTSQTCDTDFDTCNECPNLTPSTDGLDTDGDGQCDAGDSDDDNDGTTDQNDTAPLDPCVPSTAAAACATGDADGDGIKNGVECPNPLNCANTDGTGNPDYNDTDSDDDGVLDSVECTTPSACEQSDADGIPDYRDTDSDDDLDPDSSDCARVNAAIHHGATEIVNDGVDQDCDTHELCYDDADDDGYLPSPVSTRVSADLDCNDAFEGTASDLLLAVDCDDTAANVHPGASEVCDPLDVDEDCNGTADDADTNASGKIVFYQDGDGDGFGGSTSLSACHLPAGYVVSNTDCNDAAASAHPGGTEVCDALSLDEDCNGVADDADPGALGKSLFFQDADGDGFGGSVSMAACHLPLGFVASSSDCDDASASVHPGGVEVCDALNVDEDCNGVADDADPSAVGKSTFYQDVDGDGFGGSSSVSACDAPTGYVVLGTDCDDGASNVHPGGIEVCDASNVDEDCDGLADDADPSAIGKTTFYRDADGDGFGGTVSVSACDAPSGYVSNSSDCDDTSASVHPGGVEVCDPLNVDEDCDGLADDADPSAIGKTTFYQDSDGDGFGGNTSISACDAPGGYVAINTDCNDAAANVHPGGIEVCDALNVDEDCDGLADDADPSAIGKTLFYQDSDGDGFGGATSSTLSACDPSSGYVANNSDCNDAAASAHPGGLEVCDPLNLDEDCDGVADDADPSATGKTLFYRDVDGDGFGGSSSISACDGAPGYVANTADCNDAAANVHPGGVEVCDPLSVDEDCNGLADDADPGATGKTLFFRDADGDGFGGSLSVSACHVPSGYVAGTGDCDDASGAVHPGASEVCDPLNVDEDCDGLSDDADPSATGKTPFYLDSDGDGFGGSTSVSSCDAPSGHVANNTDCNDAAANVHPGATEVCDLLNVDEDCDGLVDDADPSATGKTLFYLDSDGDGFGGSTSTSACHAPSGYVANSSDCNDAAAGIHPGATEICDLLNVDEDCNGLADDADPGATGKLAFYLDSDGDGYGSVTSSSACDMPVGHVANHSDCDDHAANVHPGAPEVCDPLNVDEDCNGLADDADPSATGKTPFYLDSDGDGFGGSTSVDACHAPSGHVANNTDCNDAAANVHPGAVEVCDPLSVDEDCDGLVDDADPSATGKVSFYRDLDGDGFGGSTALSACHLPSGYAASNGDCNDAAPTVHPGAQEICDALNVDEDCDGLADDADPSATGKVAFYRDADADGFGSSTTIDACDPPTGYATTGTDCNDAAASIHPGATELPGDEIDEDCNGGEVCFLDGDGDGFLIASPSTIVSADADCADPNEGSATTPRTDCDDGDGAIHPGAQEICDPLNVDEDCDGQADDADTGGATGKTPFYRDGDLDGFGGSASGAFCDAPSGYVTGHDDCNDSDASIHPGATELCDAIDQNCDGDLVAGFPDADHDAVPDCADTDDDGDGDPDTSDCAPLDKTIHAGAADDTCDGIDQDCDLKVDENGPKADAACAALDADGDGIPNGVECPDAHNCPDTDNDGHADYLDTDADGDGETDALECTHGDACEDSDADGLPDYLERDDRDTDRDGHDDEHDADSDGDGEDDGVECAHRPCPDTDGDGIPDQLDADDAGPGPGDSDDDGLTDDVECGTFPCADSNGDGTPDYMDLDSDSDGVLDADEAPGEAANPCAPSMLVLACVNGDPDHDGVTNAIECAGNVCPDTDGDGNADFVDTDSDDDGVEDGTDSARLDPCDPSTDAAACTTGDADSDGVPNGVECPNHRACVDTDDDGMPDYDDTDSDGDGVPDTTDSARTDACAPNANALACPTGDFDGDGVANSNDSNAQDPCLPSAANVACQSGDSDGDGVNNHDDSDPADPCKPNPNALACASGDFDGDGVSNGTDSAPSDACKPNKNALACATGDLDGDGVANGKDSAPKDPCKPRKNVLVCASGDLDGDGIANGHDSSPDDRCVPDDDAASCENGDADQDGIPNGIECSDARMCEDTDHDGTPDFEDTDSDGDGVLDADECTTPENCQDSNDDGVPDYRDPAVPGKPAADGGVPGGDSDAGVDAGSATKDSDGDGISDADECGTGTCPDTDGDGIPDDLDADDDGDGIESKQEVRDEQKLGRDVDHDGIPNHLDTDSDGDGIPDHDENADLNHNGVPDYLEPSAASVAGGACSVSAPGTGAARSGSLWLLLAAGAFLLRRRRGARVVDGSGRR